MHAELSQKVVLVPTAPTSLNASLALGAIGIMVCPLFAASYTVKAI
jgi:hypothetical protein